MSWFGDIFRHMNLDLCLGGAGQRIDIAASTGSRFGYNQGFMCGQMGYRGCDMRIDPNCYGYNRPMYGGSPYANDILQAAALHRQEVNLMHDAYARTVLGGYGGCGRGYGGFGGDGCFGQQRGGLSIDFNVGASGMRCDPYGRLAMAENFRNSPCFGGGQPNISVALRNIRFG